MKRVQVILSDDVYNLGEEGDVREVASGYARNFLIPQGLAMSYSKQNVAYFEQRREAIEKRKEEKRESAKSFREKIETKVLELEMPAGDTGKLFGSVNSATIAEKLAADGINIERKKIDIPENSIKLVGEYDVRIRLYGDEVAGIKVIVNPVGGKKVTAEDEKAKAAKPAEDAPAEPEAEAAEATAPAAEEPAEEPAAEAVEEPVAEETVEETVEETAVAEEPAEEPAAEAPEEPAAEADVAETAEVAAAEPAADAAEEPASEEPAAEAEADSEKEGS